MIPFMRPFLRLLPLLLAVPVAAAKPLPDTVVRQAAARIDQLLAADLQRAELKPAPRIDDATFLRRAYLGVIGRIPSADEAAGFLNDASTGKREALIDRLTASPGFDSHLFNWAADLLRVQTRQEQFGLGWHVWLRKSLAEDKPWDAMVSEMLSSNGHCSTDPAVGYYLRDRNMQLDNFSNTMQVFLGRQIGCAQCHDHPFDDWSQYEYYEMAAFGGGIQYRSGEAQDAINKAVAELNPGTTTTVASKKQKREKQNLSRSLANQFRPLFKELGKNAIVDNPDSQLRLPDDYQYRDGKPGQAIPPATLFGEKLTHITPENRRESFAGWVVSPNNPYFTKSITNRLWQRTFGHALIGTADDLKDDSETFHPELVAFLDTTMKEADYDLRQFLRILFHTRLFQQECLTEEPAMGEPVAFTGPALTRMTAEQLHDSFLVLSNGQVDDSANGSLARSWESYTEQIRTLLQAETRDLLVLAESAKQGEELERKAQTELRAAQKVLAAADTPEARRKAQAALQQARVRFQQARSQADPLRSMQMVKKKPGRGGGKKSTLRASELPAPFNPGTLVREFGGSDRQTPSSGTTEATIPQALALLNDSDTDILTGRRSTLGRKLAALPTPGARLDQLFLTLFADRPADSEKQRLLPHANDDTALRDLATAMLTSNRFIFIQ